MATASHSNEPWRKRLHLPAYPVGEAARYTHVNPQTVTAWHRFEQHLLSTKEKGRRLSYLQLIELAVVAGFRKAKFPLSEIRAARDYVQMNLGSPYPFAEFEFKRYGRSLFTEDNGAGPHRLFKANGGGQLAWDELIGPVLEGFEYEHEGIAVRWHPAGTTSPIIIDPRISFGASVRGTPTWIIVSAIFAARAARGVDGWRPDRGGIWPGQAVAVFGKLKGSRSLMSASPAR